MTRSPRPFLLLAALSLMLATPGRAAEKAPPAARASIAWRSFDAAALETAKKEGKLIFLSILAPWGHWDRVMQEVTFNDPRVVALVNEKYIPVSIDALLRPDLFTRYGLGGWPTTTFVLPTGQPLYYADPNGKIARAGGAYYSAESLLPFLEQISDYFGAGRETVEKAADQIAETVIARKEVGKAPLSPELVEASVTLMLEAYAAGTPNPAIKTARHPDADAAEIAFAYFIRKGNRDVLDTALRMLAEMARGGIHDQVGGGFHRFAGDAAWRVPAFEKLLSINAELLETFTNAHRLTQHSRYRDIADGIVDWSLREMRDPAGWFRPYQAADAKVGEDGDYYTWTLEEFKAAVSDENEAWLLAGYDVGEWGEMVDSAPRRNVLHLAEGPFLLSRRLEKDESAIAAAFEAGREQLLKARAARPAPPKGEILIVDANASMAAALIRAGESWGRSDLVRAGIEAIDFAWDKARDPDSGLLAHAWSPSAGRGGAAAMFADQVQMTLGLLAAWESTGDPRHLERARALADAARKGFDDTLNGGWMDRLYEESAPGLLSWPTRQIRDNALFAEALLRLRWIQGEKEDGELARASRKALESWADEFAQYKEAASPFGLAVFKSLYAPVEIVIAGAPGTPGWEALRDAARGLYHPWRVVRYAGGAEAEKLLRGRALPPSGAPAVAFCLEDRCSEPLTGTEGMRAGLWKFLTPEAVPEKPAEPTEGR